MHSLSLQPSGKVTFTLTSSMGLTEVSSGTLGVSSGQVDLQSLSITGLPQTFRALMRTIRVLPASDNAAVNAPCFEYTVKGILHNQNKTEAMASNSMREGRLWLQ